MKVTSLLFAILIGTSLFAQDFQGTITYKITYDNLPEEAKGYESMMPNETVVMVKNPISKSVTKQPMTGGETIVLTDNESGKSMTMVDVMGDKYAILSGEENQEEDNINYEDTGEEKEFAGYKCKVAVAEMESSTLTVCYTKELPSIKTSNVNGLDGFPLEIIVEAPQVTIIQTVSEIKKGKVEKLKFEAPEGYTVLTAEEAKAKFQNMGM